jgi:hypothetical protein
MEEQSFRDRFLALMNDFSSYTDRVDKVIADASKCHDGGDSAMHLTLVVKHPPKEEGALHKRDCQCLKHSWLQITTRFKEMMQTKAAGLAMIMKILTVEVPDA